MVLAILEATVTKLEDLKVAAGPQAMKASSQGGGCNSDDDCPDDYICVDNVCQSLF